MAKLTKRDIDRAEPRDADYILWDDLTGFGCRIFPSGKKGYLVQYRIGARTRRLRLGLHGQLTVEEARKQAQIRLGEVAKGGDPSEDRHRLRKSLTVSHLCDEYLKACEKGLILGKGRRPKKASTIATDRGRIARHIKPLLGNIRVVDLKREDAIKFMRDVAKGKTRADVKTKKQGRAIVKGGRGTATRTVGLLGSILSYAMSEGHCPANAAHGVKTFAQGKRRMALEPAQYRALGKALEQAASKSEDARAAAILRLIAVTGLRRGEAVLLRKAEINEAGRCITLGDSKEGESVRPIGMPAFELLRNLPWAEGKGGHVFPSEGDRDAPYAGFPKAWKRLLAKKRTSPSA
jgi:integrase